MEESMHEHPHTKSGNFCPRTPKTVNFELVEDDGNVMFVDGNDESNWHG